MKHDQHASAQDVRSAVAEGASKVDRRIVGFAIAGIAGSLIFLAVVPPAEFPYYPRCQLHFYTGLHCPGCGTTRAVHALLNGRLQQAIAYNALIFFLVPFIGLAIVKERRRRTHYQPKMTSKTAESLWIWLLMGTLFLFGILRNIPRYPFTMMAPHEL